MSAPAGIRPEPMGPAVPAPASGDRYVLISADCHAGGNHEQYRAYLESRYLEEFDNWRARYSNPFRDLQGDGRSRNWDDQRRCTEQAADGVVAEVVYPNTIPPFFPTGAVIARPPTPEQYELRLAGVRAHNRWLADWCAGSASRRAGVGQILLNDIDDARADVRFCHEHGLRGGVLLPPVPDDAKHLEPLYSTAYDPLWAECQSLGVIVANHSGGSGAPDYGRHPASAMVWISEATFFSRRPLTHLLLGGVFERFPELRFVLAEQGCSWIGGLLDQLDAYHQQMTSTGRIGELRYAPEGALAVAPSEYFARNCWVAASFPSPVEAAARQRLGPDRFLWGSDYPHDEGSYPDTRQALRRAFAGVAPVELARLLGGNAARLYGFDLSALQPLADRFGPTVAELAEPYEGIPEGNRSLAFSRP